MTSPVPAGAQPKHFLPEIEALRGVAALAVVVEHTFSYLDRLGGTNPGLFETYRGVQPILLWLLHGLLDGRAAVILFFAISGFVLAIQLDRSAEPFLPGLLTYAQRRITRIVPVMWVAVLVAWPVALWLGQPAHAGPGLVLRNLFLTDTSLDPPLWTLRIELVCSAAFPFLFLAARRASLAQNLVLLALLAAGGYWGYLQGSLVYLVFFQVGLMVHLYGRQAMALLRPRAAAPLFIAAVLLCGFAPQLWAFRPLGIAYGDMRIALLLEIPACFVILACLSADAVPAAGRFLRTGALRFLGRVSFSLYLFHFLVVRLLYTPYYTGTALTHIEGAFNQRFPILVQAGFFAVVLAVSLVVATAAYHLVERPAMQWGRRIAGRWTLAAAPPVVLPSRR